MAPAGGQEEPERGGTAASEQGNNPKSTNDEPTDFQRYLSLVNNCDEQDPLLSETPLGMCLRALPLGSVQPSELAHLQLALNVEQLIPTRSGLARDYRGLAELMGFSSLELESRFRRSHNPSRSLLEAFMFQERSGTGEPTVNQLLKLLEAIERFDIIDDLLPQLVRWASAASRLGPGGGLSTTGSQRPVLPAGQQQVAAAPAGGQYDAFVCHAPEDADYAQHLIELLEMHHKRLLTVDNRLPGRFEFDAIVQMIASECRKVIVILTPNYLLSKECDFQTKFANELAMKSGWNPKIIPVLYEPFDQAQLPHLLRCLSKIDMTNRPANQLRWALQKLLAALEQDPSDSGVFLHDEARLNYRQLAAGGGETHQHRPRSPYKLTNGQNDHQQGPIVDLAYSQTDSAMSLNSELSIITASTLLGPGATANSLTPSGQITNQTQAGNPLNPNHPCNSNNQDSNHVQQQQQHQNVSQLNPMNWYRSFKQKVRAAGRSRNSSESISPSTSSRAILLPPAGDESSQPGQTTTTMSRDMPSE